VVCSNIYIYSLAISFLEIVKGSEQDECETVTKKTISSAVCGRARER
jgi:hypothetical protein